VNIESLLKSLNDHDVRYVIIGAMAFPLYGYARATLDIDLFIEPTEQNATRCREALSRFGYDMSDCSVKDLLTKKVLIRQYLVACDIHPFVKGASWKKVWEGRTAGTFGTASTNFASLQDLIAMKKAARRPKDLEDLKYLEQLQPRKQGPAKKPGKRSRKPGTRGS